MISVKGLTKHYGSVTAVDDVSFEVGQGEIIGFLGPNGAGKTTTMRIMTGYSRPTRGTVVIAGYDILESPLEVKRRVGYLPESVPLYLEMVVSAFLRYCAAIKGIARKDRAKEVDRVMERCGLREMSARTIANLSKGYRQRVGLAQSLLGSPPVLILDEPTVGLDPKQIIEIRLMIKELAEEHTVLLSTHILPEVAMVCERVLIIHKGRLVAQDTVEQLRDGAKPAHLFEVAGVTREILRTLEDAEGVSSAVHAGANTYTVESVTPELATAALVHGGFAVTRLEPRQRTLEDIFMEAISDKTGEDA